MAKYESRYKSLSFYVGGELKRFINGVFTTDDKETIAVLDGMTDATRVEDSETTEAKPAPKAPAKRTASAK